MIMHLLLQSPRRRLLILCVLSQTVTASAREVLEEVVVQGQSKPPQLSETARPVSELQGEKLRRQIAATLGETLAREPGVNNASFGPGVGLPVIRGLSGVRVKVVEDNIGAWDASSLGPDHAGGIEAVLAERICVVRGPAALTYGNGAIGGVVAVETRRIPDAAPEQPFDGFFEQRRELLNRNHRSTSALKLDGGNTRFALHADAFLREQDDTAIPGRAIDEQAVRQQFGVPPANNTHGYLGNTNSRARGGAAGFAVFGEQLSGGLSYGELRNNYGIPLGGHTDGAHVHTPGGVEVDGAHAVRIDLQQTRLDLKLGWQSELRWLQAVNLRVGKITYRHRELENGNPGTLFDNAVTEFRFELVQPSWGPINGTAGVQHVDRKFSALGAEAFVPMSTLRSTGIWLVERATFNRWQWELGARAEQQRIVQLQPAATLAGINVMRTPMQHTTYNTLLAVEYALRDGLRLTAALSRAQRAPDIQELLALGAHHATRTFDIGDSRLEAERFDNIDIGMQWLAGNFEIDASVFHNRADNFIYQENTGFFYDTAEQLIRINCVRLEECMPVQRYLQRDARFHGYELAVRRAPYISRYGELSISFQSDYVRGRLRDGSDIPRLPPLRYGLLFEHVYGDWQGSVEVTRFSAQRHAGRNETPSAGYIDVDAALNYRWLLSARRESTISLRARNVLDREIRNSTSFLRNYATEAGRSLELGIHVQF